MLLGVSLLVFGTSAGTRQNGRRLMMHMQRQQNIGLAIYLVLCMYHTAAALGLSTNLLMKLHVRIECAVMNDDNHGGISSAECIQPHMCSNVVFCRCIYLIMVAS